MCIAIYKPRGKTLKREIYENCYDNNSDGAGFIVREKDGELKMEKGFFTFESFWEHFQPHQHKQSIIHFRIKTHGKVDEDNCHPFWVQEGKLAFAHNGVISNADCTFDYSMSDTWHFNKNTLKPLAEKYGTQFIEDPVIADLLADYIGYSKIAFLGEDGKAYILNKEKGDINDGVWFSNAGWKNSWKKYSKPAYISKNTYDSKGRLVGTNLTPAEKVAPAPTSLPDIVNKALQQAAEEEMAMASNDPLVLEDKKEASPIIRSGPPMVSTLRINDWVEMLQPYNDLKGNEMGKVQAFLQHGMVQVVFKLTGFTKIRALPLGTFQKYSSAIDPDTGVEFRESYH